MSLVSSESLAADLCSHLHQVIYRFLTAGTMDEKIFQRQTTKLGLSGSLMVSDQTRGPRARADPRHCRTTTTSELRARETPLPSAM